MQRDGSACCSVPSCGMASLTAPLTLKKSLSAMWMLLRRKCALCIIAKGKTQVLLLQPSLRQRMIGVLLVVLAVVDLRGPGAEPWASFHHRQQHTDQVRWRRWKQCRQHRCCRRHLSRCMLTRWPPHPHTTLDFRSLLRQSCRRHQPPLPARQEKSLPSWLSSVQE